MAFENLEVREVLSSSPMAPADAGLVAAPDADPAAIGLASQIASMMQAELHNQLLQQTDQVLPIAIDSAAIVGNTLELTGSIAGQAFEVVTSLTGLFTPNEDPADPSTCGILNLELGPIHLDILGLELDTSAICLNITAQEGSGNLLGNLLCDVAGLLDGPISLPDLLNHSSLPAGAVADGITEVVTEALDGLLGGTAGGIATPTATPAAGECPILDLSLGPVHLDLLGLIVDLDNCEGGPVTVSLTAVEGPGNVLGNLLCAVTEILDGGAPEVGSLLDITSVLPFGEDLARISGTFAGQAFSTTTTLAGVFEPPADGADCGILNLQLGEIHLDLLGLKVDTSEICLEITGNEGSGNLLGNLICDITGLLDEPVSLVDLLNGALPDLQDEAQGVVQELDDLLAGAFENLFNLGNVANGIAEATLSGEDCPILDLSLGPINLDLLGLQVDLDDCDGGPVTIAVSAEEGPGNLLGNLLCSVSGLLDDLTNVDPLGALPIAIDQVSIVGGQLLLGGTIAGQRFNTSTAIDGTFTPLEMAAGEVGALQEGVCGILSLELAPIHLDLLGLNLDTSAICLDITAEEGSGNLLGNLLCDVAGLLDGPIDLGDLLGGGLVSTNDLLESLEDVVGDALNQLLALTPTAITVPAGDGGGEACPILDLSLGPVNLDVLGLNVDLDNCEDGPVNLALSAIEGPGNLLGNLLCSVTGLLDGGLPDVDDLGSLLDISDVQLIGNDIARLIGTFAGTAFDTTLSLVGNLLPPAAGEDCGVLSLELGEIHLDLLGLNVDTSEICLDVTGDAGPGNLLGNLICNITGALDGPISLQDLLRNATGELLGQVRDLIDELGNLLSGLFENVFSLGNIVGGLGLPGVGIAQAGTVCPILDLSLGPIDLDLLGLQVHLDDCNDGPVTVSISAEEGPGNLVGNLLCSIVGLLDDEPRTLDHVFAVGAGLGEEPLVRILDAETGEELLDFLAYNAGFQGGVQVALGDINNDGVADVVTAAGPGGGPHVQVFDTRTGEPIDSPLSSFFAYTPGFTGGVDVAVGDLDGDGFDDIVTAAGAGGGPHVLVFSGQTGEVLSSFYAYNPGFTGGVNVAVGDVNGDGTLDIITGAGAGGGPHVRVFDLDGTDIAELPGGFFAYTPGFTGGVFVSSGDVDGDGDDEIITGAGATGGPHVRVFDAELNVVNEYFAFDGSFTGGVQVATSDLDNDGLADVIAMAGAGIESIVRVFDGLTGEQLDEFEAFDDSSAGGSIAATPSILQQTSDLALTPELMLAVALSENGGEQSFDNRIDGTLTGEAVDALISTGVW